MKRKSKLFMYVGIVVLFTYNLFGGMIEVKHQVAPTEAKNSILGEVTESVKKFRKYHTCSDYNVTKLVQPYFETEANKEAILSSFRNYGYTITPLKDKSQFKYKDADTEYVASMEIYRDNLSLWLKNNLPIQSVIYPLALIFDNGVTYRVGISFKKSSLYKYDAFLNCNIVYL